MEAVGTGCAQLMHVDGMLLKQCDPFAFNWTYFGTPFQNTAKVDCSSSLTVHCRACLALVVMKRSACDLLSAADQLLSLPGSERKTGTVVLKFSR